MEIQIKPEDSNRFTRALECLVKFNELNNEIKSLLAPHERPPVQMDESVDWVLREHNFFIYDDAEPSKVNVTRCDRDGADAFTFTLAVTSTVFEWLARGLAFRPEIRATSDLKLVVVLEAGIDLSSQDRTVSAEITQMEFSVL